MEDSKIIDLFFERSEQAIGELDKAHGAAVRKQPEISCGISWMWKRS